MTNKSLRRKSLKKSLRKKKLRVSNKRNSSSRKKGGSFFPSILSRQKLRDFVIPPWLSQTLHSLDKLKFFDSTKRLEIRKNGIQLIKELGITNKLGIDCGCLTDDDCSDGNKCVLYKNQCDPLVSETTEEKNKRRMEQVLLLLKENDYDFLFENIGVFFKKINGELNSKMSDGYPIDSLVKFIETQRRKTGKPAISDEVIKKKLRDCYQIKDENKNDVHKEELTKSSLFSEENMGAMTSKLGDKFPTIISKENLISRIERPDKNLNEISVNDLSPVLMSQLEDINKNIISRKCLFDSFTSGDKFHFGVLIPCILLIFDWNNFINKFSSIRYLLTDDQLKKIEDQLNVNEQDYSTERLAGGGQKKNQRNQIGGVDPASVTAIVFLVLLFLFGIIQMCGRE